MIERGPWGPRRPMPIESLHPADRGRRGHSHRLPTAILVLFACWIIIRVVRAMFGGGA